MPKDESKNVEISINTSRATFTLKLYLITSQKYYICPIGIRIIKHKFKKSTDNGLP